ncbi:MAG TPA: hypothetical protein VF352_08860 [Anaerolineales bacterium]
MKKASVNSVAESRVIWVSALGDKNQRSSLSADQKYAKRVEPA